MRFSRVINAARHRGQSALMQNNVNILHCRAGDFLITHIGFYEFDPVYDICEIAFFARQQIVDDPYEAAL